MKKLCNALEIEFQDILILPTKLGINQQVATNRTGDNYKVSASSVNRWKKDLTKTEILTQWLLIRSAGLFA